MYAAKNTATKSNTNLVNILKFSIATILGFLLVVIPFNFDGTVDTISFYYLKLLKSSLGNVLTFTVVSVVALSGIVSLITLLFKPKFILENKTLKSLFSTTPFYVANRLIGGLIAILCFFNLGPEFIISLDTGGTMLDLSTQLSILIPPMLFLQVLILEFGIMEFVGCLFGFIVKPLFKLSEFAAVNIISAWVGPGNAAIIGTKQLFEEGFFTFREVAIISTSFSISSIGWVVLVANVLGLMDVFDLFYFTICATGAIVAFITVRLRPISKIPNVYVDGSTQDKNPKSDLASKSNFDKAIDLACDRASIVSYKNFTNKIPNALSYVISLQPIIICWGTVALILSCYTPILEWLSYPIGVIMNILNVPDAFVAAPAILSGFADNYLPVILAKGLASTEVRFIVGAMSILQLIFMSEIGALLISNNIVTKFKDILIIFLQRTLISLPIVILVSKLIFR